MRLRLMLLLLASAAFMEAQDMIILKNGDDIPCKVLKFDDGEVSYQTDGLTETLLATQIYLIKYEKRGNAFFDETGGVTYSSKTVKPSSKDILIYPCGGDEIMATEVEITSDSLLFLPSKSYSTGKSSKTRLSMPKEEVFFIRYPDGTKDIINNLHRMEEQANVETLPRCKYPFIPINKEIEHPMAATLTFNNGSKSDVIMFDLDRSNIYYRTQEWQDGPIFRLSRNKIKSITIK